MRLAPLTLLVATWLAACARPSTPAPVGSPPPSNAAPTAAVSSYTPATDVESSAYVGRLRAQLKDAGPLTLVPELQGIAERALDRAGRPGALVALDPTDGKVLALYSVAGDRGDPLMTVHEPASTFKVFSAIAALEGKLIDAETTLSCTGSYPFGKLTLSCPMAHGALNVSKALAVSCNAFFYALGEKQGPGPLLAVADAFGLGERTGIELDDPPGVLRDPKPNPERPALDLTDAIGHGAYQVSPLGLARAYAAIANGGTLVSLRLSERATPGTRTERRRLPYSEATLGLVRSALFDAVDKDYGRAHAERIEGYSFAGKTGGVEAPPLASSPNEESMDSWFVAFAPPTDPKLLVAARLERVPTDRSLPAAMMVREVLVQARALDQR